MAPEAHPFIADLPIFVDRVIEIAESIAETGLLHPITLDTEGYVIGGRHRLAACEKAGVDADFVTYDGDPLGFMLADNTLRKHQTAGQLAAENALTLDAAGRRQGGRWKYGKVRESFGPKDSASQAVAISKCGLILDHLGRATLHAVAIGERTLNDAHTDAEQARDAAAAQALAEKREAEEEAKAKAFIESEDLDLAALVNPGGTPGTYREAVAIWEQRNAEEVAKRKREEAEHAAAVAREADRIKAFLSGLPTAATLIDSPLREDVLEALDPHRRDTFLRIEKEASWPTTH